MNAAYAARVEALIAQYNADQLALAEDIDTELRTLAFEMSTATAAGPSGEIRARAERTAVVLAHMRRVFVRHINRELLSSGPKRLTPTELHAQLVGARDS